MRFSFYLFIYVRYNNQDLCEHGKRFQDSRALSQAQLLGRIHLDNDNVLASMTAHMSVKSSNFMLDYMRK